MPARIPSATRTLLRAVVPLVRRRPLSLAKTPALALALARQRRPAREGADTSAPTDDARRPPGEYAADPGIARAAADPVDASASAGVLSQLLYVSDQVSRGRSSYQPTWLEHTRNHRTVEPDG